MTVYYVCVCIYYLCVCVYIGNLATFSCVLQFNVCVHVYMYICTVHVCVSVVCLRVVLFVCLKSLSQWCTVCLYVDNKFVGCRKVNV